jgi:hypothetical protein
MMRLEILTRALSLRNQFVHGALFAYDFEEGVDKLILILHAIDVNDKGFATNKYLGMYDAAGVNGRYVRMDGVCSDSFVATEYIHGGEWRSESLVHVGTSKNVMSKLSSAIHSMLDGFQRRIEKEWT